MQAYGVTRQTCVTKIKLNDKEFCTKVGLGE